MNVIKVGKFIQSVEILCCFTARKGRRPIWYTMYSTSSDTFLSKKERVSGVLGMRLRELHMFVLELHIEEVHGSSRSSLIIKHVKSEM